MDSDVAWTLHQTVETIVNMMVNAVEHLHHQACLIQQVRTEQMFHTLRNHVMRLAFLSLFICIMSACSVLEQTVLNNVLPSESEISTGLKTALNIGIEEAVAALSVDGGYLNDDVIKIFFPEQASFISDNLTKVPFLNDLVLSQFEESMNHAAEEASKQVVNIFKIAISEMTITDALSLLNGGDGAATAFLKKKTMEQLKQKYDPIISDVMNKTLVDGLDMSTASLWNDIFTNYNKVANLSFGFIPVQPEIDITDYVLERSLDGLFIKVADVENDIRANPTEWSTKTGKAILGRVFG